MMKDRKKEIGKKQRPGVVYSRESANIQGFLIRFFQAQIGTL